MDLFAATHPGAEPGYGHELLFVSIAGRLIPLTRSAIVRLAGSRERETAAVATPAAPPK